MRWAATQKLDHRNTKLALKVAPCDNYDVCCGRSRQIAYGLQSKDDKIHLKELNCRVRIKICTTIFHSKLIEFASLAKSQRDKSASTEFKHRRCAVLNLNHKIGMNSKKVHN